MADNKGNEPKPAEAKPSEAAKSGAVRPPVLDLKARASAESSATPPPQPKPAEKPTPAKAAASTGRFAYGAALGGAALGLAAAYGLAYFGLWPSGTAAPPAADPRLAQFATAIPELETVTETTQSELATLNQRVATLETAAPTAGSPAASVDLAPVQADIAALGARVDALATANTAPQGATDELSSDVAALVARLDELAARVGTAEAGLRTLDTSVSQTKATLAGQPSDIGAVLQLPLILSGFETAFATGRPYETELAALRAAAPTAEIPTAIANAAATGLTRPDLIARRFDDVLPAMLAGRPANADAQWQDGALDWFASVIALRPTGEIEGDTPEAVISRLVGAVQRRDFASAETLLASLPAPMQAAAAEVPALIGSQAEAARFLETLRSQALGGEAVQ